MISSLFLRQFLGLGVGQNQLNQLLSRSIPLFLRIGFDLGYFGFDGCTARSFFFFNLLQFCVCQGIAWDGGCDECQCKSSNDNQPTFASVLFWFSFGSYVSSFFRREEVGRLSKIPRYTLTQFITSSITEPKRSVFITPSDLPVIYLLAIVNTPLSRYFADNGTPWSRAGASLTKICLCTPGREFERFL